MTGLPIQQCTVGGLLATAARLFPRHEAVVAPSSAVRWSFADLDREADRVAAAGLAAGLAKGDRAVVWAANLPEWLALQYGLARIGAVLVTANTAFKLEEIGHVLARSRARALFFGRGGRSHSFEPLVAALDRSSLPELRLVVGVDGARAPQSASYDDFLGAANAGARDALEARARTLDVGDLINMQYTSGTTGFPKGVMLSHRNIVQNAAAIGPLLGYAPGKRLCLAVPLFHCFGCVIGTLVAHGSGTALVLVETFDAETVLDVIQDERCTALYGVPTMYQAELEAQRRRPRDLSSLEVGVMAGASCPPELVRHVGASFPLDRLVVAYGLTEASPGVTLSRPDDDLETRATTIGRPLPGVEVTLVDPATGAPPPRGRPGELWTRGEHVMLGYDGEPEATAEVLTADGWLKTGDLAVENDDGTYRIVGRIKELIIRGGENIAPAEVEEVLRRHPAVADAAVFPIASEFFGEDVGAALRLKDGHRESPPTLAALRDHVKAHLADHKAPFKVMFVESFPLTGSGKVKKFELRRRLEAD